MTKKQQERIIRCVEQMQEPLFTIVDSYFMALRHKEKDAHAMVALLESQGERCHDAVEKLLAQGYPEESQVVQPYLQFAMALRTVQLALVSFNNSLLSIKTEHGETIN